MSGVPIGGSVAALLGIPVIPNWGWRRCSCSPWSRWRCWCRSPAKRCPTARSPTGPESGPGLRCFTGPAVPRYQHPVRAHHRRHPARLVRPGHLATQTHAGRRHRARQRPDLRAGTQPWRRHRILHHRVGRVRFGTIPTSVVAALVAGLALLALLANPPVAIIYVIFVLAGVGTHGTQCLIIAAVASITPASCGYRVGLGSRSAREPSQHPDRRLATGRGSGRRLQLHSVRCQH